MMGPININTDGIWWLAKVGLVTTILATIAISTAIIFLLYKGVMSLL